MGKFGALAILLAVAAVIYLLNPGSQIQVANTAPAESIIEPPVFIDNQQAASNDDGRPTDLLKNDDKTTHSHDLPTPDTQAEIPQFIQDSLEAKRIPASELVEQHHPDGSISVDLKGQFQHVPVAVIGKDGKMRIIEKTIEPIAKE